MDNQLHLPDVVEKSKKLMIKLKQKMLNIASV